MNETQEDLEIGIGTKEAVALKPKTVKIVKVTVETVGDKGAKKAVFEVKHPDKEDTIKVSSVKWETKGKLDVTGTWVNKDEDKKLRKGSALAVLLNFLEASKLIETVDKEIDTVEDEKGYLCFKAY